MPLEGRTLVPRTRCAIAAGLAAAERILALAADSDGIDGEQDNAGAWVAPDFLSRAAALGLKIDDYRDRNDAYAYFAGLGDLVTTSPTYTNVNDFRAVLVLQNYSIGCLISLKSTGHLARQSRTHVTRPNHPPFDRATNCCSW